MAKEGERSAPVDKGKGKAQDAREVPEGKKPQKNEKQEANGKKKGDEPKEGRSTSPAGGLRLFLPAKTNTDTTIHPEELNEEDQQLKGELEMLVERLKVWLFGAEKDVLITRTMTLTLIALSSITGTGHVVV